MKAELRHDSLASRIYAKASAEDKALRKVHTFIRSRLGYFQDRGVLMETEDLAYVNPYLDQLFLSEEEAEFIDQSARSLSKRKNLIRAGIVLGILFLAFVAFSVYQWRQAEAFSTLAQTRADSASMTKAVVAQKVVLIEEEKEKVESLTQTILLEKVRVDSLRTLAIALADSARKAERLAEERQQEADSTRKIYEAAQKRIRKMAIRSHALFMLSEANQLLEKGDVRMAFLLAEQTWRIYPDSLTRRVLTNIAQSRVQFSIGHAGAITALDLSSDEAYVVSGSQNGEIKITNLQRGEIPVSMAHAAAIQSLYFSDDNAFVLSASRDRTAILWNRKGEKLQVFSHNGAVNQAVFTSSGHILTASDDNTARLWDREGYLLQRFRHNGPVNQAVMHQRGQMILTTSDDHTARLWSVDGALLGSFTHDGPLVSATFSPEGGTVLTASKDSTAKLWRVSDKELIAEIRHEDEMASVSFHPTFKDEGVSDQLLSDRDGDGVNDLVDQDHDTPEGAPVNKFGVALDTDEDGVIDLYDIEKDTPWGAPVNWRGKALDKDEDGVIDLYDLEKDTPREAPVNMFGIALDSDGDHIIDLYDEEKDTPKGFPVDEQGISIDIDVDGVPIVLDRELHTPKGAEVDQWGRALDGDKDGVIDLYDLEKNSAPNARVDLDGQTDSDGDGYIDREDQEVQSPERAYVNNQGQADNDRDGVIDTRDQEWYTPEQDDDLIDPTTGKAIDSDRDGFPDLIDFQVHTPKEFIDQVDAFGREPGYPGDNEGKNDRTDDAIPNLYDIDSDTPEGAPVDFRGVALDSDEDGVPDFTTPRPQFILTSSRDGAIRIWDLANGWLEFEALVPASLSEAGFLRGNTDQVFAVSSMRNQVLVVDTAGVVEEFMRHPSPVNTLHVLRDQAILTGAGDGILRMWGPVYDQTDPLRIIRHYQARFAPLNNQEEARFRLNLLEQ